MSAVKDLAVVALPELIKQVGEGVREALKDGRERDKPCDHGRPGGRLCPACAERRSA